MQQFKSEAELAEMFMQYFSDWKIYTEVPVDIKSSTAGSIDMVAVKRMICEKGELRMAVECKLKFNYHVLEQGFRNRGLAHFSYIAVPKPKLVPGFIFKVCRDYGIGVLLVEDGRIREVVKPTFNRKIKKIRLEEWMLNSVAGSLHGRETMYSVSMEKIVQDLKRNGGRMNINNVFAKTTYHWSTATSAKNSILTYIRKGYIKNIFHDKGFLILRRLDAETSNQHENISGDNSADQNQTDNGYNIVQ